MESIVVKFQNINVVKMNNVGAFSLVSTQQGHLLITLVVTQKDGWMREFNVTFTQASA